MAELRNYDFRFILPALLKESSYGLLFLFHQT